MTSRACASISCVCATTSATMLRSAARSFGPLAHTHAAPATQAAPNTAALTWLSSTHRRLGGSGVRE